MKEIDGDKVLIYAVSIALAIVAAAFVNKIPRTRGKNPIFHAVFLVASIAILVLLPEEIQDTVFSPGGVVVVGTLLPLYVSIQAVCTCGEEDDSTWLNFWVVSGSLSYLTEFIDDIAANFPEFAEHWYELEFFLALWMLLPFTDGATLFYDKVTEPYIKPYAMKVKSYAEGWIAFFMLAVNSSYLWFAWFIFMSFPEEQRRFFVVAMGTVYPVAASIIALTTKEDGRDDTFWLTYWSSFSLLFLAMDYIENFIGHVRGFYSICMVATIYLFLPAFDGANVVFRRILVPLSGQYENMLLHDAYLVRRDMEKSIPTKYHERVFQKASDVFMKPKEKSN